MLTVRPKQMIERQMEAMFRLLSRSTDTQDPEVSVEQGQSTRIRPAVVKLQRKWTKFDNQVSFMKRLDSGAESGH